jgi:DnaJ-class molecular chaperone
MELHEAYEELGVLPTDSLEEVKRAYRKLLLRHHPDKCGGEPGAAERFMRVQNAYTIVVQNKESNINFFLMFLFLIKSLQCGGPQDVTLKIAVPIQDVYNGKIKKLTYRRMDAFGKRVSADVFLELVDFRERYVIEGYGDYDVWTGRWSDLVIDATVDYTGFENVRLENLLGPSTDVCVTLKISVYEHYFGVTRTIPFFNGTTLSLQDHVPCRDGTTVIRNGGGLLSGDDNKRRGDLYVFLETDLNRFDGDSLEQHKEVIQKIFDN